MKDNRLCQSVILWSQFCASNSCMNSEKSHNLLTQPREACTVPAAWTETCDTLNVFRVLCGSVWTRRTTHSTLVTLMALQRHLWSAGFRALGPPALWVTGQPFQTHRIPKVEFVFLQAQSFLWTPDPKCHFCVESVSRHVDSVFPLMLRKMQGKVCVSLLSRLCYTAQGDLVCRSKRAEDSCLSVE